MVRINPSAIEIRNLLVSDIQNLITLWNNDPEGYNKHFIPFDMNYDNLKSIFANTVNDIYLAVIVEKNVAGFFMLRGFDAGYEIPSYGVWISSQHSNKGLAKLTLQYSIALCKIAGIKKIMLKVHPENKIAINMYRKYGFAETGIDERIGHIIMYKDLN